MNVGLFVCLFIPHAFLYYSYNCYAILLNCRAHARNGLLRDKFEKKNSNIEALTLTLGDYNNILFHNHTVVHT